MWELSKLQTEGGNNQMMPHHTMMKIHVLLVDHESESLFNTLRLLEICQYKVTIVELASAALQMLTCGKVDFDLVMANSNSPDLHAPKLVQHAVTMDLPTILLSTDDDTFTAMGAIENGAFLCIKKPLNIEVIKCMWQHVVREKMRVMRERERVAATNYSLRDDVGIKEPAFKVEVNPEPETNDDMFIANNKGRGVKNSRSKPEMDVADEYYDSDNNNRLSKKVCTEWTQELHAKFTDAVAVLGEGKCFPKEILELMNVPGLTRMQVASHLQKCRNAAWRSPDDRKTNHQPLVSDVEGSSQSKTRRFGSMPRLGKYPMYGVESSAQSRSETETDGHNEGSGIVHHTMENTNVFHHQQPNLGHAFQPAMSHAPPNNISSATSFRMQTSDEFFNFPVMDNSVRDYPRMTSQGYHAMNINANQHNGSFHYDPYGSQNPMVPSMDRRSPWSSQRPGFGSDDKNTKAKK